MCVYEEFSKLLCQQISFKVIFTYNCTLGRVHRTTQIDSSGARKHSKKLAMKVSHQIFKAGVNA
jgi:hypothetical protein